MGEVPIVCGNGEVGLADRGGEEDQEEEEDLYDITRGGLGCAAALAGDGVLVVFLRFLGVSMERWREHACI